MFLKMQKKSFRFDKKVFLILSETLNLDISSKFCGNLREFGEILGKYRMLDVKPVGSKGLNNLHSVKKIQFDLYQKCRESRQIYSVAYFP